MTIMTETIASFEYNGERVALIPAKMQPVAPNEYEQVMPDGLRVLGPYALAYCSALKKVTLPDGLELLESGVFQGCVSLTEITLPDSIRAMRRT